MEKKFVFSPTGAVSFTSDFSSNETFELSELTAPPEKIAALPEKDDFIIYEMHTLPEQP